MKPILEAAVLWGVLMAVGAGLTILMTVFTDASPNMTFQSYLAAVLASVLYYHAKERA